MRLLAGLLVAVIGLSSQGCAVQVGDGQVTGGERKLSNACEPRSFDLSQPPSREGLGLEPGASFMDVSCDEGFEMTITLPEDAEVSLTARRVNADSYSAANPESGAPTTVDVHSVALDADAAVQLASKLAADLGISARPLQAWQQQVAANASGENVDSPFLRNRLGYLTAEMQVQHLGTSGNNYVHLIFTWS